MTLAPNIFAGSNSTHHQDLLCTSTLTTKPIRSRYKTTIHLTKHSWTATLACIVSGGACKCIQCILHIHVCSHKVMDFAPKQRHPHPQALHQLLRLRTVHMQHTCVSKTSFLPCSRCYDDKTLTKLETCVNESTTLKQHTKECVSRAWPARIL